MSCHHHDQGACAVVCRHHVATRDQPVGFIENNTDPADPQAWCVACEERFLDEGGFTDAFRAFNDCVVVCGACYHELRQRHAADVA
ncbi:MAG: hypothetical protein IPL61_18165 [Myxococcales bacterium]|nr:hypothetical protein [Myxococcales bacterium]